jgi:hypothetical protein
MPRYFFHFLSKDEFIPDYEGVVLANLNAAHRHAMRLVVQTIPALADEDLRHWKIEIADERQYVALTVLFPVAPPPEPRCPQPMRATGRPVGGAAVGLPDTIHPR